MLKLNLEILSISICFLMLSGITIQTFGKYNQSKSDIINILFIILGGFIWEIIMLC